MGTCPGRPGWTGTAVVLVTAATPLLLALGAGAVAGTDGSFSYLAAWLTGAIAAAVCTGLLAWPRPGRDRDEPVPGIGPDPAVGATVEVRTHFGPMGGYVEHGGLVRWAYPAGGAAELVPGARCVVTEVPADGGAAMTVASPVTAGGAG